MHGSMSLKKKGIINKLYFFITGQYDPVGSPFFLSFSHSSSAGHKWG
jgi:hypothetical protein